MEILYKCLIAKRKKIRVIEVDRITSFGTPEELENLKNKK